MVVDRCAFDVKLLSVAAFINSSIKRNPVTINHSNNFKLNEIEKMFLSHFIQIQDKRLIPKIAGLH
jgi:hypothetical protein